MVKEYARPKISDFKLSIFSVSALFCTWLMCSSMHKAVQLVQLMYTMYVYTYTHYDE